MASQLIGTNLFGNVSISGGNVHLGDRHIIVYQNDQQRAREQRAQFLASLRHPEMNARLNEISNAGHKTFEWVFEDATLSHPVRPIFATWLMNGNGNILVQGKAGSGKSTFMRFLFEHHNTEELLQRWAKPQSILLLFHSFWLIGTRLQRNFKGLLASLVHQIISKQSNLYSIGQDFSKEDSKHNLNDWNENELRHLLLALCRSISSALCIFVDGLDEFDHDDDFDRFHELIFELQQSNPRCKFCLSTRPSPHILDYFRQDLSLKLQDLTIDDIRNYVQGTLRSRTRAMPQSAEKEISVNLVRDTICWKAEGVFLWVHYVLQNVCVGLRVGEDLTALQQRILLLPSAVEQLYRHMWNMQNGENVLHSKEASAMFSLGRHFPMPLFQFCIALQPTLIDQYLRDVSIMPESYLKNICETMVRKLHNRSAGLIESVEIGVAIDNDLGIENDNFWGDKVVLQAYRAESWRRMKIQYIHRTVHDFLTDSEEGQLIIGNNCATTPEEVDRRWVESWLACFIEDIRGFSVRSLYDLRASVGWLSQRQCALLEVVNMVCTRLVQQRILAGSNQNSDWYFEMHKQSHSVSFFHSDLPGLMAGSSLECIQYLLITHGKDWSAYYKGYLAFCAIIHILWENPILQTNMLKMVHIVQDLKIAGADLTAPHPYNSSRANVLAIRSPAARLVQELCITGLRHHRPRIGIDAAVELIATLSDLNLKGQNFTIYWLESCEFNPSSFALAPGENRSCMITFDAGEVLHALIQALEEGQQDSEYHVHNEDPNRRIARFAACISNSLANLAKITCIVRFVADSSEDWTEHIDFAGCTSEQNVRLVDLIFHGGDLGVLDEMIFGSFKPPSWPMSDLNFEDSWDEFRPYLKPLDPHVDTGPDDWMARGCLRDYFASRDLKKDVRLIQGELQAVEIRDQG